MSRRGGARGAASCCLCLLLAACSGGTNARRSTGGGRTPTTTTSLSTTTTASTTTLPPTTTTTVPPHLAAPAPLTPLTAPAPPGDGTWSAAGRPVGGVPAVFETELMPPGGTQEAGVAWMDTRLLSGLLYSGSKSPGGGPYQLTAPIEPAQAATVVAAFNGGFLMKDAGGGYYTEGKTVVPLVDGAASLVIEADGTVTVGAWGSDVTMTPGLVAVRQNLVPLVEGGQPTAQATSPDWQSWGNTCGATSCAPSVPGIEYQWRSGVGVTAQGALVYAVGPSLSPAQLADLLVHAGTVRAMELDINPNWPVFATYDPPLGVPASPLNGVSLHPSSVQGPATFFNPAWARDFVTMSARSS